MKWLPLVIASVWLAACATSMAAEPFMTGVDANYAPALVQSGTVWKCGSTVSDLLSEFRRNGANAFRVRVWTGKSGQSGLTYATKLAGEAQKAGLKPYLVLFLSADWSDVGKQPAPPAWRDLPFAEKVARVKSYAQETARHFLQAGVKADLYEIGNEIDYGLCGEFDKSLVNRASAQEMAKRIWPREARIIRAAEEGVLAANPHAKFMLHLAQWWKPDFVVAFLQAMEQEKVRVDYVGLSYYPTSGIDPTNGLADFGQEVQRIEKGRKVPVIICEYAYPSSPHFAGMFSSWTKAVDGYPLTEAGQARWIAAFLAFCRKDPDIRGAFYWSPEWNEPKIWSALALFRPDGSAKPGLASLGPAGRH